jgi:outer membrane protein OmpA-like peptidoglycan-associated protein
MLAGLGSCAYLAYRAKKKVDEIQQALKSGDPNKIAGSLGAGSSGSGANPPASGDNASNSASLSFPEWNSSTATGTNGNVALRPGLTVVTAIAQFGGDYESIKRIQEVGPNGIRLSYRADNVPNPLQGLQKIAGEPPQKSSGSVFGYRSVRAEDLRTAHDYAQQFGPMLPEEIPGSTAISVSREVLADLKSKGETSLSFRPGGIKGIAGGLLGSLGQMSDGTNPAGSKEAKDIAAMGKESCTLKRVGGISSFPVLLNDQRVSIPAVHAQCTTEDGLADFYFLDNPDNPLALAWKLGTSDTLQVIKISYPAIAADQAGGPGALGQPKPGQGSSGDSGAGGAGGGGGGSGGGAGGAGSGGAGGGGGGSGAGGGGGGAGAGAGSQQIEQELKQQGKAEVYGIYFDFASDQIKPESEPVLQEIADALRHNPGWKLRVEGHTDNIGGDDYNMDLSHRRAQAVKQALVTRYHIAEDQLAPQGFGATRPKEPNDTLAGRARNRRVELVRQ